MQITKEEYYQFILKKHYLDYNISSESLKDSKKVILLINENINPPYSDFAVGEILAYYNKDLLIEKKYIIVDNEVIQSVMYKYKNKWFKNVFVYNTALEYHNTVLGETEVFDSEQDAIKKIISNFDTKIEFLINQKIDLIEKYNIL